MIACVLALALASTSLGAPPLGGSAHGGGGVILPERERAAFRDACTARRLDTVVPELMRRTGIDVWILVAREYAEDPVVQSMLPATWFSARRRTVLLFHDTQDGVERLAVSRYDIGDLFPSAWDKEQQPDQWRRIAELVEGWDPERIGLDVSPTFALADGLTHGQHKELAAALGPELMGRVVSAEPLAIGWLETRIAMEMEVYPSLCQIAHDIIAGGFSRAAIQPGITTTADLEWWYRERVRALHLDTWFHPSVSLQRNEAGESHSGSFASEPASQVIHRGDLLHVDFGITYLGLNTDTQQHAYVLRAGETAAPPGLVHALAEGNRLQDVLTRQFVAGRTGNEILSAARAEALASGLKPTIYTHPLGYHGHGAGPTIGLWDQQSGVPGRGDYPLHARTAYSIELNTAVAIPEWGDQEVLVMLEEDAYFDGERVHYLDGRQTELILVP